MFRKILIPAGLVLALTPFVLFPVCTSLRPDGSHMSCWYSGVLITAMGGFVVLLAIPKKFQTIRTALSLCCALACWFIPNRIINLPTFGLCGVSEHACRADTMPAVGILVMLIAAVNIVSLAVSFVLTKRGD